MMTRTLVIPCFALFTFAACVVTPPPAQPATQPATQPWGSPPSHESAGSTGVQLDAANWAQAAATTAPTPMTAHVHAGQVPTDGIVAPLGFRSVEQTGIRVAYGPTQNFARIRDAFQQAQVFEQIATTMNRIIVMPRMLNIQMAECGTVNAFYDSSNSRIIMCYEMVAHTFQTFSKHITDQQQVGTAGVHASLFIFFHEFGHALRDILDLPVTGREEDAVDQFSTMLLIEAGSQEGVLMGAQFFGLESQRHNDTKAERLPFWDEHSLEQQRFYNILCLLYGSNPQAYEGLVKNQALPLARARRCPEEYKNIDAAWTRLLAPHLSAEARGGVAGGTQPVAAPKPAPMPAAPTPSPQGAITCETIGQRVVQLIMSEYQQQMGQLTQGQQETIQQQLSQMYSQLVQQCQVQTWSSASRQCVMQSTTLAQAEGCN